MTPIRYQTVDEVPVSPWLLQGTVYESARDAKFAAAKLYAFCNNIGVVVKAVKNGWTLFYWQRNSSLSK